MATCPVCKLPQETTTAWVFPGGDQTVFKGHDYPKDDAVATCAGSLTKVPS